MFNVTSCNNGVKHFLNIQCGWNWTENHAYLFSYLLSLKNISYFAHSTLDFNFTHSFMLIVELNTLLPSWNYIFINFVWSTTVMLETIISKEFPYAFVQIKRKWNAFMNIVQWIRVHLKSVLQGIWFAKSCRILNWKCKLLFRNRLLMNITGHSSISISDIRNNENSIPCYYIHCIKEDDENWREIFF